MSTGDRSGGRAGARGQSEVIGVVLLLGFTVIAAGTIVVVGSSALDSHQQAVDSGNAENELALLGSRAAEVALGDSNVQSVPIDDRDGEYEIREDSGWMQIEHVNRTPANETETIANVTLGSVTYSNGGTELAFQGGGIWERDGDNSSMISPPNFYYRDGTLTLPVINVTGDDRTGGLTEAIVRQAADTQRVFPNESRTYSESGDRYRNPVSNGTVRVTVYGDYYEGWKEYFDDRTGGDTTIDHENETATVDLVTLGDEGDVDLSPSRPIRIRGATDDEPVENFSVTIVDDDHTGSGLNNLNWWLKADGDTVVEVHNSNEVSVTVHNSSESWTFNGDFETESKDGDEIVDINFTSTEATDDGVSIREAINNMVKDYGPDVDLEVENVQMNNGGNGNGNGNNGNPGGGPPNSGVSHDKSTAYIDYTENGAHITFLQITQNKIEIEFT